VESSGTLMGFGSKCDKRNRLAVTKWILVKKALLKQNKQQDVLKKGISGL